MVIFTSLDYQLFSAMRSSLRSERRRSELLFVENVRFRASFFCVVKTDKRLNAARRTKRRFFAFRLTAKRLLCGVAAPLPPKGTAVLALKNYRSRSVFYSPLAYHLCAVKRLRRFFVSAVLPAFFGYAFLSSFGTLSLGASVFSGFISPEKLIFSPFLEFLKVSLYSLSKLLYINAFISYFLTMEGRMDKYSELWEYVRAKNRLSLELSFEQILEIAKIPIDHSFLTSKKQLLSYGFRVEKISIREQKVIFKKV